PGADLPDGRRPAHRLAARVARQPLAQLPRADRRRHRRRRRVPAPRRALHDRRAHAGPGHVRGGDAHGGSRARHARAAPHRRALPRRPGQPVAPPQPALRRLRRTLRHPRRRPRRHRLAGVVGADGDNAAARRAHRPRGLPRPLRRPGRQRGVQPLQGHGDVHDRSRPRRRLRAPSREEVLPARAVADRLRGLPARSPRGRLPRARRLRPRRLAGHHPPAGEPPRVVDLDRRSDPHPRHRAGARPRAPEDGVSRRVRWLLPLAALPLLALLAYGFRTDPRDIPSPLVGRPAAPFALTAFDGARVDLAALRGKVVVLNFWASWCNPACYDEAPVLERLWRTYRERGVVVVGVDIQDTDEAGRKFIREFGLTFPNARDGSGKVSVDYGVYGVPETFFVARDGTIRAKHVGALSDTVIRAKLEPLLGWGAPKWPRRLFKRRGLRPPRTPPANAQGVPGNPGRSSMTEIRSPAPGHPRNHARPA